jgi:hypothetical protein
MSEPKKRRTFSIQDKMDMLAQVDANMETHVALALDKELCRQHRTLLLKTGKTL